MTNDEISEGLVSMMRQMLAAKAKFVAEGHSPEAASQEVIRQANIAFKLK